jgi:hypothetical protein
VFGDFDEEEISIEKLERDCEYVVLRDKAAIGVMTFGLRHGVWLFVTVEPPEILHLSESDEEAAQILMRQSQVEDLVAIRCTTTLRRWASRIVELTDDPIAATN